MFGMTTSGYCSLGSEMKSPIPQIDSIRVMRYTAVLFLIAQSVGPNVFALWSSLVIGFLLFELSIFSF